MPLPSPASLAKWTTVKHKHVGLKHPTFLSARVPQGQVAFAWHGGTPDTIRTGEDGTPSEKGNASLPPSLADIGNARGSHIALTGTVEPAPAEEVTRHVFVAARSVRCQGYTNLQLYL